MEYFKDDKYIYYLMVYKLAKANKGYISIGHDNETIDGHHYERRFRIQEYKKRTLLIETKSSKNYADYSRTIEFINPDSKRPTIMAYINDDNENCYKTWTH
jgi:hypothetical protein